MWTRIQIGSGFNKEKLETPRFEKLDVCSKNWLLLELESLSARSK
jgi:hypothetical protein